MFSRRTILAAYILKRFFTNVLLINIGFTLLFNLIEFFEKMVRVKQTSGSAIVYFILLNLIPSFFENLPIASWLGSCMTILQMQQQNEWELLQLLNIKISKIFGLLLIAGTVLALFSFAGREFITGNLAQKAERFKLEKFKQNRHKKLFNQWFALDKNTFCFFRYLDLHENSGDSLSVIEVSQTFSIKKITFAPKFSLVAAEKAIFIPSGTIIFTNKNKQQQLSATTLQLPSFFTQLRMQGEALSLQQLFHTVIFDAKILPPHIYHQLLYLFLSRILLHLLLLLYPLLTFAFFFLFPYHRYHRWILMCLPYPLVTLLITTTDSLQQFFGNGLLAIIPYVLLSLITFASYFAIRK